MWPLLCTFSWQELRHHPWRNAAAVVAVMLGVALAFAVHLINASALDEFSTAVRSVNGQPDLELRAATGSFDEAVFAQLTRHPQVLLASPVLELSTMAATDAAGPRTALRVVGVDALVVAQMAPALMPRPTAGADRFAVLAPGVVFLNPAAQAALGTSTALHLQNGLRMAPVRVAGTVAAGGPPLAVMDIGAAQDLWDRGGQLSRIDLRLQPGTAHADFTASLRRLPGWPPGIEVAEPGDAAQRVSNLSRAYRVNLAVLALVALFTGAFLVFSVLALSVAKRAQQFALLGVLGLTPRERLRLVLAESLVLGVVGSAAGMALGTLLAALALRVLGGDLGGGYFAGVAPALQWSGLAAAGYGALGVAAALIGGWCFLSLDRLSEARATFAIALKSGGKAEADAAYGTALTLLRAKLTDDAEAILNTYAMTPARDREIRAEIYVQRARAAFDTKQYQKTLDALNARASLIAEPADLSQLRGWAYYHLGNRGVANQVFRRLSEHMADAGVARGLAVTSDMGGRQ